MSKLKIRFQIITLDRTFLMKVTFQFVTRIFKKKKKEKYIQFTAYHQRVYVRLIFLFCYLFQLNKKKQETFPEFQNRHQHKKYMNSIQTGSNIWFFISYKYQKCYLS